MDAIGQSQTDFLAVSHLRRCSQIVSHWGLKPKLLEEVDHVVTQQSYQNPNAQMSPIYFGTSYFQSNS